MAVTTTGNPIIKRAMRLVGALDTGETPPADQTQDALEILNWMVMAWQNRGIPIWQYAEAVLYLVDGQSQYALGSDKAALHGSTTNKTELSVAGAAADLTITVDSITGLTDGDVIGIELDDDTIQWTTINGTPAALVITITAALTGAAAIDNHVYAYTTLLTRPLKVWNPRLVQGDASDIELPVTQVHRDEYMDLSDKTTEGRISDVYYDPQMTYGQLYVNPPPSGVQDRLNFTVAMPLTEFSTTATAPDFPAEWFEALSYGLADRLAGEYGTLMPQDRMLLKQEAEMALSTAEFFAVDPAPVSFLPDEEWG